MTQTNQDALDYSNDAQQRVAADTRCLVKKATITTTKGQQAYPLPADVIHVLAVLDTTDDVPYIEQDAALSLLSGTDDQTADTVFFILGTQIGFFPLPQDAHTYTFFYHARPAALTSDADFEVSGDFENLVERLVQSMKLLDDGQPELAAEEQAWYDVEHQRLRRRNGTERRQRMLVIGFDSVS